MLFKDRNEAAKALAIQLKNLELENPIFLAIPTGGVPIGSILCRSFNAEFGLVLVRKITLPTDKEVAIGAVSEDGDIIIGSVIDTYGISEENAEDSAVKEIDHLRQLRADYTPGRGVPPVTDRTVVIVDDGVASGATAVTALRMLERESPARIIIAAPFVSDSGRALLESEGGEVCAAHSQDDFTSISEFYEDFSPVTDQDVKEIMARYPQS